MRTALLTIAALLAATAHAASPDSAMNPGAPGAMTGTTMDGGMAAAPTSPPDMNAVPGAGGPAGTKMANGADGNLLMELHASNLAEIQEGQMAQTRATSPKVKKYGEILVKDHTKADKLVTAQATRLGVTLSDTLPADQQSQVDALKAAPDAQFDKTFVQAEASGHDKVISDVENQEKSLSDPQVKKLARKLLPTLRKHEKIAQHLSKEMTSAS